MKKKILKTDVTRSNGIKLFVMTDLFFSLLMFGIYYIGVQNDLNIMGFPIFSMVALYFWGNFLKKQKIIFLIFSVISIMAKLSTIFLLSKKTKIAKWVSLVVYSFDLIITFCFVICEIYPKFTFYYIINIFCLTLILLFLFITFKQKQSGNGGTIKQSGDGRLR